MIEPDDMIRRRAFLAYCLGGGAGAYLRDTKLLAAGPSKPPSNPHVYDLRKEPEIEERHRHLPLICDAGNYVEDVFRAVGFASKCWTGPEQVFDMDNAIRVANELCALVRLHKEGKIR